MNSHEYCGFVWLVKSTVVFNCVLFVHKSINMEDTTVVFQFHMQDCACESMYQCKSMLTFLLNHLEPLSKILISLVKSEKAPLAISTSHNLTIHISCGQQILEESTYPHVTFAIFLVYELPLHTVHVPNTGNWEIYTFTYSYINDLGSNSKYLPWIDIY